MRTFFHQDLMIGERFQGGDLVSYSSSNIYQNHAKKTKTEQQV